LDVDRRFRGACCLHHQALKIPEDSELHTVGVVCYCYNLFAAALQLAMQVKANDHNVLFWLHLAETGKMAQSFSLLGMVLCVSDGFLDKMLLSFYLRDGFVLN
jgi:hypothetical protein